MLQKIVTCCAVASVALATPASAADVPFVGPSGWSHVEAPPSADPTRKSDTWHIAGDVASITFISDANGSYTDALAAIEQNFKTNGIKPVADKDVPCQGKTAHVVEFSTGPDGHKIVINRVLVPSATGAGVVTITYARSDGSTFDPDVKKSETAYCTAAP